MKHATLALLVAILLTGIANLLAALGIIGEVQSRSGGDGGNFGHTWEYRVLNADQMDAIGFNAVAKEAGVEPDEEGRLQLPAEKVVKTALLPRTIQEVEAEGWEFVSVTSDHHYVFRRPK